MKKSVKIILSVIAAVILIAIAFYYNSRAITVETIVTEKSEAEMYFIEKGEAVSSDEIDVYSMVTGRIATVEAAEDGYVKKGDIICILDTSELNFQIIELESSIKSYEAQIANLSLQETKERDSLNTNKQDLQAQLKLVDAMKSSTDSTKSEQIEMQKVINNQYSENLSYAQEKLENSYDNIKYAEENLIYAKNNLTYAENDLKKAEEDLEKYTLLFENGVISQNDYENSERVVDANRKALDAAKKAVEDAEKALSDSQKAISDYEKQVEDAQSMIQQGSKQINIIETGDPSSSSEYHASQREQILTQIQGIDTQLSKSYNASMSDYYTALINSCKVNIQSIEDRINDYIIKSPVDGRIEDLYVKDLNFISPQSPIAKISEIRENEIEVYVTTNNIDEIQIDDEVQLILKRRDEDKIFSGRISKIDDKAVDKISSLGIEEKRVKVTVVPDDEEAFKSGYDVDVKFIYYKETDAITVPKTALFKVDDKDMVWAIQNNRLTMVSVQKGRELRTEYVIKGGLSEDEYIVKDANEKDLAEGKKAKGAE